MTHAELIDALGGTGEVARRFGFLDSRVSNWRHRGVPWRWRPPLAEWARRRKIKLPDGFLRP